MDRGMANRHIALRSAVRSPHPRTGRAAAGPRSKRTGRSVMIAKPARLATKLHRAPVSESIRFARGAIRAGGLVVSAPLIVTAIPASGEPSRAAACKFRFK
jgi:hypothetical protein